MIRPSLPPGPVAPSLLRSAPILPALAALALIACAGGPGLPDAEPVPADLSYHRSLRMSDYVRPYPQEAYRMPDSADAVVRIIPFASSQPVGENRTLALIDLRVRQARPQDPHGSDSACLREARLTIMPAPGFTLVRLYGAEPEDTATGTREIDLGDLRPGERRIFIAELEASREAGKQRLLGTTLRGTRTADGNLYQSLEGLSLEWQLPDAAPKVNPWAARNSLLLADAEALVLVGRLAESGQKPDLETALSLVDLQLNSIEVLHRVDSKGLGRERKRFLAVRKQLAGRIKAKDGKAPSRSSVAKADRPGHGVALASQAPAGPWSTVARLLTVPL